jgi:hypothetical protein
MCMILGKTAALWRGMHALFHTIHDITRMIAYKGFFRTTFALVASS